MHATRCISSNNYEKFVLQFARFCQTSTNNGKNTQQKLKF